MKHYFKKTGLTLFLSLALILSLTQATSFAYAAKTSFSDVPAKHWAKATIDWGVQLGIIQGDGNNRFRPNDPVNQAEFMALLIRAFPNDYEIYKSNGKWYEPYYALAKQLNWQYEHSDPTRWSFERGMAAMLIYNALEQKEANSGREAVEFLLNRGIATGKTSNDYQGFGSFDTLTRAEAVTFIYRVYNYVNETRNGSISKGNKIVVEIPKTTEPEDTNTVSEIATTTLAGVKLNTSIKDLVAILGEPTRKAKTPYIYDWYVYNKDGKHYRYAIADNKVVGFYSNSLGVFAGGKDYEIGRDNEATVRKKQAYTSSVTIVNTFNIVDESYTLELMFDPYTSNKDVDSMLLMDKSYLEKPASSSGSGGVTFGLVNAPGTSLDTQVMKDLELGVFDITNAYRYKHGLTTPLKWSPEANKSAYLHSKEMYEHQNLEHNSLDGRTPFDRMTEQGISYYTAGENIASGYPDDITVMSAWISSKGHRDNILYPDFTHLGVGVYSYYTQNFYGQ